MTKHPHPKDGLRRLVHVFADLSTFVSPTFVCGPSRFAKVLSSPLYTQDLPEEVHNNPREGQCVLERERQRKRERETERERERERGRGRKRERERERERDRERERQRERERDREGGREREGDGESERESEKEREALCKELPLYAPTCAPVSSFLPTDPKTALAMI